MKYLIVSAIVAIGLTACQPMSEEPPVKKVTLGVLDGKIVAWNVNPADVEWDAHEAGCIPDLMVDAVWTGEPKHGNTWNFRVDGYKEVGLDFNVPFGITSDC